MRGKLVERLDAFPDKIFSYICRISEPGIWLKPDYSQDKAAIVVVTRSRSTVLRTVAGAVQRYRRS